MHTGDDNTKYFKQIHATVMKTISLYYYKI